MFVASSSLRLIKTADIEGQRNMASEPKRKKTTDQPPSRRENHHFFASRNQASSDGKTSVSELQVAVAQPIEINSRIQLAKNFAVAQAQQDGCTGNYRIFDSPFGNFLVPVVPSRAELSQ